HARPVNSDKLLASLANLRHRENGIHNYAGTHQVHMYSTRDNGTLCPMHCIVHESDWGPLGSLLYIHRQVIVDSVLFPVRFRDGICRFKMNDLTNCMNTLVGTTRSLKRYVITFV